MAGITGSGLYLKFGTTVLDTDYRVFKSIEEGSLVDQSAGSDTSRTYLTVLKDGTVTTTIVIQASDTTTWGAIAPHTEGTLEWGDEGTAAGKPKHSVNAIVSKREKAISFEDLTVADIAWQFSGDVSDSTY